MAPLLLFSGYFLAWLPHCLCTLERICSGYEPRSQFCWNSNILVTRKFVKTHAHWVGAQATEKWSAYVQSPTLAFPYKSGCSYPEQESVPNPEVRQWMKDCTTTSAPLIYSCFSHCIMWGSCDLHISFTAARYALRERDTANDVKGHGRRSPLKHCAASHWITSYNIITL